MSFGKTFPGRIGGGGARRGKARGLRGGWGGDEVRRYEPIVVVVVVVVVVVFVIAVLQVLGKQGGIYLV